MPTLDDVLLPVLLRQHWLATLTDVLDAGFSRQAAARRLASGRWILVDRNVYRPRGIPKTWESRLLAPILSAGPGAVASHFAAAALHGVPGMGRGAPELSVPRGREHRRKGMTVHTSTDLDLCRVVSVDGIPVTDVERTLLDMGRRLSVEGLTRAVEGCRRAGQTDWSTLIRTLAVHARPGRPGIRRLRQVILDQGGRREVTDSDFELLVLGLLREAGLPEPVLHHKVFDRGRFVAEVDLAYPPRRIAIELDGAAHLDAEVRERDLPRQNDLVLLGWTVLRFSWRRFTDRPDLVLDEIRAALEAASAR